VSPELALDLARESLRLCLVLAGPLLVTALLCGIACGMIQTAFQVHEHSMSFVPKLFAVVIVLSATMPWFLSRIVEFAGHLISEIPRRL
jgi:flagellar biosynthetic protein FliQ